jgi:hypothetical protein
MNVIPDRHWAYSLPTHAGNCEHWVREIVAGDAKPEYLATVYGWSDHDIALTKARHEQAGVMAKRYFTVDDFLRIAATAEVLCDNAYASTYDEWQERLAQTDLKKKAFLLAEWLESTGRADLSAMGVFTEIPFKKGDRVMVLKGTPIETTQFTQRDKRAGCNYPVTIHDVKQINIYVFCGDIVVHEPMVTWVGAGKYWHSARAADVAALN